MSQVSFCIFDNGRYRHVLLNQTFHVSPVTCIISCSICLQCVSIVYAHMHVHAQQYDRTAAHRSSVQQLANPVNHNVMSIQLDILGAVSQNFHVSLLSVQCLCLRISREVIALCGQLPVSSTIFSGTSSSWVDGQAASCAFF